MDIEWRREAAFWLAAVVAGVLAGVTGIAVTELLHLVQHVAYGFAGPTFLDDVRHASPLRRVLVMTASGAVAGLGWLVLRRHTRPLTPDDPDAHTPVVAATADGALQIVVVALGASLGREGAPRQVAAALGGRIAECLHLDADRRRTVVAAAAGAGLAAVYNVPLAGALFTLEVLLRRVTVRAVAGAALCSGLATVVSWTVLPNRPSYLVGSVHPSWSLAGFAVVVAPFVALCAVAFRSAASRARVHRPVGWRLPAATTVVFAAVGAVAMAFPELLGNGRSSADLAFTAELGLGTAAVLMVLKPLATVASLRSGAVGGLIAPSIACGSLIGMVLGSAWGHLWPGDGTVGFALVGAAAFLTVTQRAPVTAAMLTVELTGVLTARPEVLPAVALAAASAWLVGQRRHSGRANRTHRRARLVERGARTALETSGGDHSEHARAHRARSTTDAAVPRGATVAPGGGGAGPAAARPDASRAVRVRGAGAASGMSRSR